MLKDPQAMIRKLTDASEVSEGKLLQSLWSGYGSIMRYQLDGSKQGSVIVKHVSAPNNAHHPRGWNTDISHQRKLKSYQVETTWYKKYAKRCTSACRVPKCLGIASEGDEIIIVLEDLDAAGFSLRKTHINDAELEACLQWLASFHASFFQERGDGLWESGTYWHLETRPDELKILEAEDPKLFAIAQAIDAKLKASPYQTLVHGDAKLANFCFSKKNKAVAAVDFQYVGVGCGMKDLAYFVGSCFDEDQCEARQEDILSVYFDCLRTNLKRQNHAVDIDALVSDWQALYPIAWTDFHRFLKGWSPGHWKIHSYSEKVSQEVIASLTSH